MCAGVNGKVRNMRAYLERFVTMFREVSKSLNKGIIVKRISSTIMIDITFTGFVYIRLCVVQQPNLFFA
jgi:hypothetical protein